MFWIVCKDDLLLDIAVFFAMSADGHNLRLLQNFFSNAAYAFMLKRGREQEGLALGGTSPDNSHHLITKAHVQHTVCFIEDQEFKVLQDDAFFLYVFSNTTRCAYDEFGILPDQRLLFLV